MQGMKVGRNDRHFEDLLGEEQTLFEEGLNLRVSTSQAQLLWKEEKRNALV